MEVIRSLLGLGRLIAGAWGVTQVSVAIYELATRPDRDVWVDMIGSVVSLHSLYLAAILIGFMLAVPATIGIARTIADLRPNKRAALRFRSLAPEIERVFRKVLVDPIYDPDGDNSVLEVEQEKLRHDLAVLRVDLPGNPENWALLLPSLLVYAKTGQINAARKL